MSYEMDLHNEKTRRAQMEQENALLKEALERKEHEFAQKLREARQTVPEVLGPGTDFFRENEVF